MMSHYIYRDAIALFLVVVTQAETERAKGAAPISEFSWLLDNQTLVDGLSSPRQQFDEHAIARRHSAVRKSEAGNVRRRQAVGELRRCDFDCVHGRCNPITRYVWHYANIFDIYF